MALVKQRTHFVTYDFEIVEEDQQVLKDKLAHMFGCYRFAFNEAVSVCDTIYVETGSVPDGDDVYAEVVRAIDAAGWGDEPRNEYSVYNAAVRARGKYYRHVRKDEEAPRMYRKHSAVQRSRVLARYEFRDGDGDYIVVPGFGIELRVKGVDPMVCALGKTDITLVCPEDGEPAYATATMHVLLSSDEVIGRFEHAASVRDGIADIDPKLHAEMLDAEAAYNGTIPGSRRWLDMKDVYADALALAACKFDSNERGA